MALGLHNLKTAKGSKTKPKKRLGRGPGSGKGAYSGRGQKGQRARSGGKNSLKRAGLKTMLRNKPKIGGFKSQNLKMIAVNLELIEKAFSADEVVNAKKLLSKGVIKTAYPGIKILGQGALTKKMTIVADAFSESAKKAILAAGGVAEIRTKKSK